MKVVQVEHTPIGDYFHDNHLIKTFDELCNEDSYKSITEKGAYVKELVEKANNPQVIDVRGIGLMLGIKVKCTPALVQKECIKKGLLVLTAGKDVVRLLPPLVITKEQIDEGVEILSSIF